MSEEMDQRVDQDLTHPVHVIGRRLSRRRALGAGIVVAAGAVVALAGRLIAGTGSSESPDQRLQQGLAFNRQQRYREAVGEFTKVIQARPDSADAYVYRGIASYESAALAASVADFTQALQLRPDNAVTYLYRGDSYRALGKTAEALADYKKALARAGNDQRLAVTVRTKLWLLGRGQ